MKRTFPINLGGKVFYIDEDAYTLLDNYLHNLRATFSDADGTEIVNDIESRIAELFGEKLVDGKEVISLTDVNEMIDCMGRPEEMNADSDDCRQTATPPPVPSATPRRRLFRDPDDKILGGVASGIANYLNWNANLLRLLLILLACFGYGTIILLYIIAWILIPEAKTAENRLAMRGEAINIDTIGQTVKAGYQRASDQFSHIKSDRSFGDKLFSVIGWILKIVLIFFAVIFSPVLFVLAVVLFSLIMAFIGILVEGPAAIIQSIPGIVLPDAPLAALGLYISLIFAIGIPIISIIWATGSAIFHWRPASRGLTWTAGIIWILAIASSIICLAIQGFAFPVVTIYPDMIPTFNI